MQSTITGPYPRIGTETGDRLRAAINNGASQAEIEGLQGAVIAETVQTLLDANITLPHSGLAYAHDEISWPLESLAGVELGGIEKIYGTNMHYRKPVVTGKIIREQQILNAHERLVSRIAKVELPGPFTLAQHATITASAPYATRGELAQAFADAYRAELQSLRFVQFNEPALCYVEEPSVVHDVYRSLVSGLDGKTAVWTYYGEYREADVEALLTLPVDVLGFDFAHTDVEKYITGGKAIGFGIVDAGERGQLRKDNPDEIERRIRSLESKFNVAECYVASSATLEHLPADRAYQKVRLIAEIAGRFQ